MLAGLLRCSRCGMQLKVSYRGRHRYRCDGLARHYGSEQCFSVPGSRVDAAVRDAVFQALRAEQIDLLETLLSEHAAARAAVDAEWERRLEHARYDVRLAERRYRAVDPENRRVAATLERDWNRALAELEGAEAAYARYRETLERESAVPWSAELREKLRHLGESLSELWPDLTNAQRSQLIRALVSHVVIGRSTPQRVHLRIVWVTGHYTDRELTCGVHRLDEIDGYESVLERIRTWTAGGALSDPEIAERLNAQGLHPPRREHFDAVIVGKLRRRLGLVHPLQQARGKDKLDGQWTVRGLARHLGIDRNRLYPLLEGGQVAAHRHAVSRIFLIEDRPDLLDEIRRRLGLSVQASHNASTASQ